jgi:hypothetical protein
LTGNHKTSGSAVCGPNIAVPDIESAVFIFLNHENEVCIVYYETFISVMYCVKGQEQVLNCKYR